MNRERPLLLNYNGSQIDGAAQLLDIDRYECEQSLYQFLRSAWRIIDPNPWKDGWVVQAIAEHLQAVCDGEIRRLVVNVPPRMAKSSLISVAFGPWVWAQTAHGPISGPGAQFLYASYADKLSLRDSVKSRRLIESSWYQQRWGSRFRLTSDQNTKSRFTNDKGGERLITSIGAGVTGEGGTCFVAGTLVSTPTGKRKIEEIKPGDMVFAFDSLRGKVVKSKVLATSQRIANGLCTLHESSGRKVVCTQDHLIYSPGRGYIRATEMGSGDPLFVLRGYGTIYPEGHDALALRQLRSTHESPAVLGAQSAQTRKQRCLLQQEMLLGASRYKKFKTLRSVCKKLRGKTFKILLGGLQKNRKIQAANQTLVSYVFQRICWVDEILYGQMCGQGAFNSHEWRSEFQVPRDRQILQSICSDADIDLGARRLPMCGVQQRTRDGANPLPSKDVFAHSSHQWQQSEQRTRESDYVVPGVSQKTPLGEVSHVKSISCHSGAAVNVYDIQVEGCSNFFADDILVHNCIIADDPNSAGEAFSEAAIQTTIDWWSQSMSTRLNDMATGAYIVIQQRLAEDDLTGYILDSNGDEWVHLCLPMRYEKDRARTTSIGWSDPRTEEGQLLWPERFDDAAVRSLEKSLGPMIALGQLQQRPEPVGGGIIRREWWQVWDSDSLPPLDFVLASLDTAYTMKTSNDYSALTIWGVFSTDTVSHPGRIIDPQGRPLMIDRSYSEVAPKVIMIDAWRDRFELHNLVEEVARRCIKHKVDLLLIENKAAGISVAQEIRRLYYNQKFGVQLFDPKSQDKLSRLYSVQHLFAEGIIYAPKYTFADMVISEAAQFPHSKHDDLTDTVSQALRHLRDNGLISRATERAEELESLKVYPGRQFEPLYPA